MQTEFFNEQDYIDAIALPAQNACKQYGYLPSVLIAQSCLQNGYGIRSYWDNPQIESLLKHNNMVGIKSELLNSSWSKYSVWPGKSLNKKTPEEVNGKIITINDDFRIYDNPEQSFCDYLLFLKYASNYGLGGKPKYGQQVLSIKDPKTLITEVKNRGYATSSKYPTNVMNIINKHNLTKYDDLSSITPSNYTSQSLKSQQQEEIIVSNIKKIQDKKIIDVTAANKSQVPRSRGSNKIQYIVCHYLGVKNADNENLYGGGYGGHYYISRTGKIYKAANPSTAVVWQCGGGIQGESKDCAGVAPHKFYQKCTNYNSIGIECGVSYDSNWYFSEQSQESYVYLVSKLMDEYSIPIDRVIRHFDVTGKTCPAPWVNSPHNTSWTWTQFKDNLKQYRKDKTITIPSGKSGGGSSSSSSSSNLLKKGTTGSAVKNMQLMLIACGYDCGKSGADGDFGNNTFEALKKFQKDNELDIDGIYGPKSNAKLTEKYNEINKQQKQQQQKKSENSSTSIIIDDAISYDKTLSRKYVTTAKLNMRAGAGTDKTVITILPMGTQVVCYGYHTGDWYCVQYNGQTGYCNKQWLR